MAIEFPDTLIPSNEAARLRTLHHYQIVNTTAEPIFDDYVAWTAQLFNSPISLISLVDEGYVHFKAITGAEGVPGLVRTDSMCSAAILLDTQVVTGDYSAASCHLISTDVAQAFGLKFYAGSALRMSDGSRIGMLAVIGREARAISPTETTVLSQLAGLVSRTIELRLAYLNSQEPDIWVAAQQELADNLDENSALTRYLNSRNGRIDFEDDDVLDLVQRRLNGVGKVLSRRLAQAQKAA